MDDTTVHVNSGTAPCAIQMVLKFGMRANCMAIWRRPESEPLTAIAPARANSSMHRSEAPSGEAVESQARQLLTATAERRTALDNFTAHLLGAAWEKLTAF